MFELLGELFRNKRIAPSSFASIVPDAP